MIPGLPGRLRSAAGRLVVALLLIAAATVLQFWNEGRSMRQQRLLDDAAQVLVEVSAERPHPTHDGRLVYLRALARADSPLRDPDLEQPAEGLALRRTVEMYQWREQRGSKSAETADGQRPPGGELRYERVWHDEPIDHLRFDQPGGHQNPGEFPFTSRTWRALTVHVGGFRLAEDLIRQIDGWRPMAAAPEKLPANLSMALHSDGQYLTTVDDAPQIGDLRIRFERIPAGMVSVIAAQQDGWLAPWAHDGQSLALIERGERSAADLLAAAERSNHRIAWLLRLVGFLAMWGGFGMLLGPLARAFGGLPIAGRALRWASATLSGLLSGLLSFVAIGSGFLFHRPWLLFAALTGLALVVAWVVRRDHLRLAKPADGGPHLPPPPPPPSR